MNNQGFSLVETVIAAGMLAGGAMVMVQMNEIQHRSLFNLQALSTRDNVKIQLERYLSNKSLLKNTADFAGYLSNRQLSYCLNGVDPDSTADFPECPKPHAEGQACCEKTPGGMANAFFLMDPSDATKTRAVAGTDAQPASYRIDGTPCVLGDSTCPIEAITRFVATCPDTDTVCAKADVLRVMFEVRQKPGTELPSKAPLKTVIGEMAIPLQ